MERLSRLLADDRCVISGWTGQQDPMAVALLAATKLDAVTFDMQHNMATETSVARCIPSVAATGKPAIVRIPVGRFEMASKALDAGAHAIIAPMINTIEDAKSFVAFSKYPPMGERSFGVGYTAGLLGQGSMSAGDYTSVADRETLAIAMIETVDAFEIRDEIISLDGIDALFCGPSDLSISVRGKPSPEPFGDDTREMVAAIAASARNAGKLAATYCVNAQTANLAHEMGYRFIGYGSDAVYLNKGIEPMLDGLKFR